MLLSSLAFDETCSIQRNCREGSEEIAKKMCEEPKCVLVDYDSLPDYLKDNEFIVSCYRCEWPLKETVLSMFSVHNETLNVWTHLIGFLIFLVLTVITAMMIPREESIKDEESNAISPLISTPITRWPFFAFLCGAMFCLLASSVCHLTSCHSERTSYLMLRLDYTGISTLIVTSFYPLVYYSFICDPFISNLYICFITTFGVASVLVSFVPVFQTAEFRTVRASLFFCMGISGLVPIVHKLVVFSDRPEAILSTGYEFLMGVFYGLGIVAYVTRVPERWKPGKFDLVGNSHQLFHVLVIAGAYTHYLAGLVYLEWRDVDRC
ncbi:heptahelical transmembrane protein 5-like [Asparagus officinalis]|uniref:heptahelical transmembrane protein 5-like n=1 Tax=Asparagus officinalis TaxID=4686 RepID=UPI00098E81B6|nr:heptahelical transmembrane protein 5-like [Asparagus officinalis]XP_020251130.1 heptahelical transmembrane protein 5-like [Asparagus officinalis]